MFFNLRKRGVGSRNHLTLELRTTHDHVESCQLSPCRLAPAVLEPVLSLGRIVLGVERLPQNLENCM